MSSDKFLTVVCGFYGEDINLLTKTLDALEPVADLIVVKVVFDFKTLSESRNLFREKLSEYSTLEIELVDSFENIGVPFVFNIWLQGIRTKYFTFCGEGDQLLFHREFLEKLQSIEDSYDLIIESSDYVRNSGYSELPADILLRSRLGRKNNIVWSQVGAIMKSSHVTTGKVNFDSAHYWDEMFQLTYMMNSRKVLFSNFIKVIRNSDSHFSNWVANNRLINLVQVPLIRLKFLKENQHILPFKGIGIYFLFCAYFWVFMRYIKFRTFKFFE